MLSATRIAISGSSQSQPVSMTRPIPTITPMEVYTSVRKCLPSASSAMEWCTLAALSNTQAMAALMAVLPTESNSPQLICSRGCG